MVLKSGRGLPAGGIMPARSFLIIFSVVCTSSLSCAIPGS